MNVAEYIFNFLSEKNVDTAFMVSGGQAMFLVDALYRNKKIKTICNHHEQACGMAAEAYARITGKIGVALVTAGPGSVNVINGLVGGWTDSAPMMIISGQSNLFSVQYQQKTKIRQYGIQGINIKPLVENVTKYFITVDDPAKIKYYMDKAYYFATSDRPGPVWVDVPLDIQRMEVPEDFTEIFEIPTYKPDHFALTQQLQKTYQYLQNSKRPLIIAGQGVRIANAVDELLKVVNHFDIPVVTTRLGIDIINSDDIHYVGRPGNYGDRPANFAIQNADLIISLGSRLASATIGHNPNDFGRNAKKIVIDVDIEELNKPGINIDVKIKNNAKSFLEEFLAQKDSVKVPDFSEWVKICNNWKTKYPVCLPEYKDETPVNSYYFSKILSNYSTKDDMVLVDTGSCFHVACQVWDIKKGQRFLTTGGLSSMGYWVAGIGACAANDYKRTIVITGDGSLQMNLQEFATIKHNNLPIKVFIFNNNGYLLIRFTQKNFMENRLFGEGPESGVWCPDSLKIADAYGIKGVRISSPDEVEKKIKEVMEYDGPVICDVITPEWQLIIPRVSSDKLADGSLQSRSLEDMFPYLDREDFLKNIIT
jgi:acetolactate synthase-1/2/3 large subunit